MFLNVVIVVLVTLVGLAAIAWVANWPFNTPWEKDLSPEERRINAEHNRRHHRAAARMVLPILAIVFGVTSVSILVGPKSDQFAAAVMGVCSAVCGTLFVVVIKRGRRRRSSTQR